MQHHEVQHSMPNPTAAPTAVCLSHISSMLSIISRSFWTGKYPWESFSVLSNTLTIVFLISPWIYFVHKGTMKHTIAVFTGLSMCVGLIAAVIWILYAFSVLKRDNTMMMIVCNVVACIANYTYIMLLCAHKKKIKLGYLLSAMMVVVCFAVFVLIELELKYIRFLEALFGVIGTIAICTPHVLLIYKLLEHTTHATPLKAILMRVLPSFTCAVVTLGHTLWHHHKQIYILVSCIVNTGLCIVELTIIFRRLWKSAAMSSKGTLPHWFYSDIIVVLLVLMNSTLCLCNNERKTAIDPNHVVLDIDEDSDDIPLEIQAVEDADEKMPADASCIAKLSFLSECDRRLLFMVFRTLDIHHSYVKSFEAYRRSAYLRLQTQTHQRLSTRFSANRNSRINTIRQEMGDPSNSTNTRRGRLPSWLSFNCNT